MIFRNLLERNQSMNSHSESSHNLLLLDEYQRIGDIELELLFIFSIK